MNTFEGIKNFKPSEFDSPDLPGSGMKMNHNFLLQLQQARNIAGTAFVITSGYRTKAHTLKLQKSGYEAVNNSAHEKGLAADISYNKTNLNKILNSLIKAGFYRIGIGSNFIHVDIDKTKPYPAVWDYTHTPASIKKILPKLRQHLINIVNTKKKVEQLLLSV